MFEDDDLKQALRRVDPPAGFEHRVMARLHDAGAGVRRPERRRLTAWVAAAAMSCASIAGIAVYHQEREERARQEKAMAARDQLIQALQITSRTLDTVREQINNGNEEK